MWAHRAGRTATRSVSIAFASLLPLALGASAEALPPEQPVLAQEAALAEAAVANAVQAAKASPAGPLVVPVAEGAAAAAMPAVQRALSRSTVGLEERRLRGPAGGYRLQLGGRFQSALVATRDAAGNLTFSCIAEPPASGPAEPAAPAAVEEDEP